MIKESNILRANHLDILFGMCNLAVIYRYEGYWQKIEALFVQELMVLKESAQKAS